MDYDTMDAGREMNELVARKVMGSNSPIWRRYSVDIVAAWEVVEKISNDGFVFHIHRWSDGPTSVEIIGDRAKEYKKIGESYAPTAPLAICRASLKAIECP